jgi:hypothetical protein
MSELRVDNDTAAELPDVFTYDGSTQVATKPQQKNQSAPLHACKGLQNNARSNKSNMSRSSGDRATLLLCRGQNNAQASEGTAELLFRAPPGRLSFKVQLSSEHAQQYTRWEAARRPSERCCAHQLKTDKAVHNSSPYKAKRASCSCITSKASVHLKLKRMQLSVTRSEGGKPRGTRDDTRVGSKGQLLGRLGPSVRQFPNHPAPYMQKMCT